MLVSVVLLALIARTSLAAEDFQYLPGDPMSCIDACNFGGSLNVFVNTQRCGQQPKSCCTPGNILNLVECYQCIADASAVSTGKPFDNTLNQGIIDGFMGACERAGLPLNLTAPQITLLGQDPNLPGVPVGTVTNTSSSLTAHSSTPNTSHPPSHTAKDPSTTSISVSSTFNSTTAAHTPISTGSISYTLIRISSVETDFLFPSSDDPNPTETYILHTSTPTTSATTGVAYRNMFNLGLMSAIHMIAVVFLLHLF